MSGNLLNYGTNELGNENCSIFDDVAFIFTSKTANWKFTHSQKSATGPVYCVLAPMRLSTSSQPHFIDQRQCRRCRCRRSTTTATQQIINQSMMTYIRRSVEKCWRCLKQFPFIRCFYSLFICVCWQFIAYPLYSRTLYGLISTWRTYVY